MKKTSIFIVLSLLIALQAGAVVPKVLTYSGKVTDKNGILIPDGKYDMRFSFWTTQTGGTSALWTELHYVADGNGVTVTAGGFNTTLGAINTALPDFSSNYYLQTEININGWETFGRRAINSVAYAKRTEVANQVADNCITSEKIANGAINNQAKAPWAPAINGGISNPKICFGTAASQSDGTTTTINFPTTFTSIPLVMCTAGDTNFVSPLAISTTGFQAHTFHIGGAWNGSFWTNCTYGQTGPIAFQYIAIGN